MALQLAVVHGYKYKICKCLQERKHTARLYFPIWVIMGGNWQRLSSNIGTWCLLVLQLMIRIILCVNHLKWRSSIWKWRGGIWRRVVMSPPW